MARRPAQSRRVTLRDIAERCGVSAQTVSRIVRGETAAHDAETCRRVLETAARLGYRPNASARATRSGRFGSVSLLLSEHSERALVFEPLLAGILDELEAHDLQLLVSRLPDALVTSETYVPRILRELMADGLLVNYNADIPAPMVEMVARHGLPAVWMNSRQPANCVYPDDVEGGDRATRVLHEAGHRAVTYVHRSATSHYSGADRLIGYRAAMARAGLAERVIGPSVAERDARGLLAASTALVAYSPADFLWAWEACLGLGRRVPETMSAVVFHDAPLHLGGLSVDTMLLPFRQQGRQAVAMLVDRIASPGAKHVPVALPCTHHPAATVRPPAERGPHTL